MTSAGVCKRKMAKTLRGPGYGQNAQKQGVATLWFGPKKYVATKQKTDDGE